MNLNCLSPQIKEMILDGKQPKYLKLQDLMADVPALWSEQEKRFLGLK
jgi:site-specific DNA recombinase